MTLQNNIELSEGKKAILSELQSMKGKVGFYYKNIVTGETLGFNEKEAFLPASVVKLPLLMGMLLLRSRKETDFSEMVHIRQDQKIPGCGAVRHMTGDVDLDVETLYKLMITISDNTATNALFRHYGAERISEVFHELGMQGTQFNREYYDFEKENQGIQNYFVPEEIGILLEKMYHKTLINKESSELLEHILLEQQINHKIPGKLPMGFPVAHKTGEEEDKSHDVGVVYAKQPFVVCFASNDIDIAMFEDFIRRASYILTQEANQG